MSHLGGLPLEEKMASLRIKRDDKGEKIVSEVEEKEISESSKEEKSSESENGKSIQKPRGIYIKDLSLEELKKLSEALGTEAVILIYVEDIPEAEKEDVFLRSLPFPLLSIRADKILGLGLTGHILKSIQALSSKPKEKVIRMVRDDKRYSSVMGIKVYFYDRRSNRIEMQKNIVIIYSPLEILKGNYSYKDKLLSRIRKLLFR